MKREELKIINYWKIRREVNGLIEKQCSRCGEWKIENKDNFYMFNKSKPELGFVSSCKNCGTKRSREYNENHQEQRKILRRKNRSDNLEKEIEYNRKWREENSEHVLQYTKNYQKENKDRFKVYNENRKIKNHKISNKQWQRCLSYFNYECAYCGATFDEHKRKYNQQLHKEHVIHNGENDLSNCVPACKDCNSHKWEFPLEEWYPQQDFYLEDKYNKILKWLNKDYKKFL